MVVSQLQLLLINLIIGIVEELLHLKQGECVGVEQSINYAPTAPVFNHKNFTLRITVEPLNKEHFGTGTKSKHLSFIRKLYLLSFM